MGERTTTACTPGTFFHLLSYFFNHVSELRISSNNSKINVIQFATCQAICMWALQPASVCPFAKVTDSCLSSVIRLDFSFPHSERERKVDQDVGEKVSEREAPQG